MPSSIINAAGSVIGGGIGASGSKSAAKSEAEGIRNAQNIQVESAKKAREDALALYDPALTDFSKSMQSSLDTLKGGQGDVERILRGYNTDANRILSGTGANAQRAIMGLPMEEMDYSLRTAPYNPNAYSQPLQGSSGFNGAQDLLYRLPEGAPSLLAPKPFMELDAQPITQQGFALPTGVTNAAYMRSLDELKGMATDNQGRPLTEEDRQRMSANHAQSRAITQTARNRGINMGRDLADLSASASVGIPDYLFPSWEQQYAGPVAPTNGPVQDKAARDLASIAMPINFGR